MTINKLILASVAALILTTGCSETTQTEIREAGDAVADDMKNAGEEIASEAEKVKDQVAAGLEEAKTEVTKAGKESLEKGREALDAVEDKIDDSGE